MGMSASQARYLQLTARKSDVEYQAQQIMQAKLALSDTADAIAREYNAALSNRRMYFVTSFDMLNGNNINKLLQYSDIVGDISSGGLGMKLVDARGNIVVPESPENLDEGYRSGDYSIDADVKDSEYLDKCLRNGKYFLAEYVMQKDSGEYKWQAIDWTSCQMIQDNLFADDDAQATAKYETETANIQRKEKLFDLNLKGLETERTALETEMDVLKKVIDSNTDAFKNTFG